MQLRASCSHFWSMAESVVEVWRNTRRKLNLFFRARKTLLVSAFREPSGRHLCADSRHLSFLTCIVILTRPSKMFSIDTRHSHRPWPPRLQFLDSCILLSLFLRGLHCSAI